MKAITLLKIQTKNKNKVNVYLDGSYFCALSLETVMKHNLKAGMMIEEKILEDMQFESEKSVAYEQALKLISTRYKTRKEMENYLQSKGYAITTIYYVLKKLGEYNFIDDERYAESFASHHIQKDGVVKIKQHLFQKGVSEEIIDRVLAAYDDQTEQVKILLEKYMKNKEKTKESYQKACRYLYGKGFKMDDILKVLKGEVEDDRL